MKNRLIDQFVPQNHFEMLVISLNIWGRWYSLWKYPNCCLNNKQIYNIEYLNNFAENNEILRVKTKLAQPKPLAAI